MTIGSPQSLHKYPSQYTGWSHVLLYSQIPLVIVIILPSHSGHIGARSTTKSAWAWSHSNASCSTTASTGAASAKVGITIQTSSNNARIRFMSRLLSSVSYVLPTLGSALPAGVSIITYLSIKCHKLFSRNLPFLLSNHQQFICLVPQKTPRLLVTQRRGTYVSLRIL